MRVRIKELFSPFCLSALLLLPACASTTAPSEPQPTLADEGRAVFRGGEVRTESPESARNSASDTASDEPGGWGIVLRSLPGDPPRQQTQQLLATTQQALGRSDVRLVRRTSGVAVVLGSYAKPDDPRAKRDLEYVRAVTVGGRRPFARAFLAPPQRAVDYGDTPQYNLATVRSRLGNNAIWTLQIGVYDAADRDDAKRAAENAVTQLRREGEQAFYYHGRTQSMVTIGVFGPRDYDEQRGPLNPQIFTLIEKYPLNLLNGQYPIVVKRPGQPDREQRSTLVRIPEPR